MAQFGAPHWVDFGQELEHSPDGKAYLVGHGATSPASIQAWMLGDQVYMARVTPTVANIGDKTKWEFYAGGARQRRQVGDRGRKRRKAAGGLGESYRCGDDDVLCTDQEVCTLDLDGLDLPDDDAPV
eukprot:COSAG05_NODE_5706_length_1111_cov_1.353755_2_plen_127_part_00